ncbi:Uncharacterised protein [Lysinibacillus sphaericus]|uniref:Uncharacterized protein n=1 Tax=Lysinibacillus sphaericus TaxID=1421 RepID=A0AAJ4ZRR9_LYSSH|nr:Uncharacterised protein [Lysinibacillus sphaericus]
MVKLKAAYAVVIIESFKPPLLKCGYMFVEDYRVLS